MRVNISYSVDLEEVLDELHSLYIRESNRLQSIAVKANVKLKEKYTDKNLSDVKLTVEELKLAVDNFSIKLAEIDNILSGYYGLKFEPKETPVVAEAEVTGDDQL